MKLKTVLLRLGSEKLIKLIDDDIFKILRLRNKQLINQQNLTDIVLQINSERKLISESKTRELIIDALKEKEAYLFGKIFNVQSKNIWEALKNINCKKQKNLDAFYQLFEIDLIEKINFKSPDDKINPIVISPSYSLFSHQIDVLNKINNLLEKPVKKALLHMPTGSGKTTTLYAALQELNNNELNISTVEDPVEYFIDGINQTQINNKVKMTVDIPAVNAAVRSNAKR